MDLLNLFKASSGDRTRESTNEDSCSEDEAEDEEDSETIGESDGEQAHDAQPNFDDVDIIVTIANGQDGIHRT